MTIGEKIKNIRTLKGLTQKSLAEKAGISQSAITYYEKNERIPSAVILEKIATALNVSMLDLIVLPPSEEEESIENDAFTSFLEKNNFNLVCTTDEKTGYDIIEIYNYKTIYKIHIDRFDDLIRDTLEFAEFKIQKYDKEYREFTSFNEHNEEENEE